MVVSQPKRGSKLVKQGKKDKKKEAGTRRGRGNLTASGWLLWSNPCVLPASRKREREREREGERETLKGRERLPHRPVHAPLSFSLSPSSLSRSPSGRAHTCRRAQARDLGAAAEQGSVTGSAACKPVLEQAVGAGADNSTGPRSGWFRLLDLYLD